MACPCGYRTRCDCPLTPTLVIPANEQKYGVLLRVSMLLIIAWVASLAITTVLASTSHDADVVTQAEHEKLRAEQNASNLIVGGRISVLEQRLTDDEKIMARDAAQGESVATTLNRLEGMGMALGVALGMVQFLMYRAHMTTLRASNVSEKGNEA